ncbi:hypothetical protein OE88DRAFT_1650204 [Heliocybe sulcata]|uniref:Uncharacterized protein n=1 Tax=Heliocybe sulcata TaxID=5364 RepID=A0A5C3NH83_9AGAM|nr:hypothetical protein OE88DRAFT_1650204 [Heliocybe sulcata]
MQTNVTKVCLLEFLSVSACLALSSYGLYSELSNLIFLFCARWLCDDGILKNHDSLGADWLRIMPSQRRHQTSVPWLRKPNPISPVGNRERVAHFPTLTPSDPLSIFKPLAGYI